MPKWASFYLMAFVLLPMHAQIGHPIPVRYFKLPTGEHWLPMPGFSWQASTGKWVVDCRIGRQEVALTKGLIHPGK